MTSDVADFKTLPGELVEGLRLLSSLGGEITPAGALAVSLAELAEERGKTYEQGCELVASLEAELATLRRQLEAADRLWEATNRHLDVYPADVSENLIYALAAYCEARQVEDGE